MNQYSIDANEIKITVADCYYHTLVVLKNAGGETLIAAHTNDSLDRNLDTYSYARLRPIHILGVRRR